MPEPPLSSLAQLFPLQQPSPPLTSLPEIDWSRMNQPMGELKPATYTPTQQIGNATADALMSLGANPGVANHLAEGLGNIAMATPAGIAGSALNTIAAEAKGDKPGAFWGMAGMIPGAGPEARAARNAINWDRATLSRGELPIYGDKKVIDIPLASLDRAFKATDPHMYLDNPKTEVAEYAASGNPMSVPEVDAYSVQGGPLRLGFTNGRNRFAVARDNGETTIPVATETPDELRALLAKHGDQPKHELPKYITNGPYSGETTPISGKTLHHETSPENAAALIREDLTNEVSKIRPSNMFMTDNPDIAIGQGGNGVKIEYAGDLVSGSEHAKPGTGDMAGREYRANGIGNGAIRKITVAPGERMDLPPAWERRLSSSFKKQELPDGSIVYTHNGGT